VRGTHLDGLWVAGVIRGYRAAAGLLLLSSATVATLDGGRPAMKSG
jgi:hypothetical protein